MVSLFFLALLLVPHQAFTQSPSNPTPDTATFPIIENNPNIKFAVDHPAPEPDNSTPNIKKQKRDNPSPIPIGKRSSFFKDLFIGLLLIALMILMAWLWQRFKSKMD